MRKLIFDIPNHRAEINLFNYAYSKADLNLTVGHEINLYTNTEVLSINNFVVANGITANSLIFNNGIVISTITDYTSSAVTEIEVNNNYNLIVKRSEVPLNSIVINNSQLTLNNCYNGEVKTTITIDINGSLIQTGEDLPIEKVFLLTNARFEFTHNNSNYVIHNNDINYSIRTQAANADITANAIEINDIHSIVEIAVNLKNINFKTLKSYEENTEILDIFTKQNNLFSNIKTLVDYKNQNYFKLNFIAKSLEGSSLAHLPNEIMTMITSWLKLTDVKHHVVNNNSQDAPSTELMGYNKQAGLEEN